MPRVDRALLALLVSLAGVACATAEPSPQPEATPPETGPTGSPSPGTDPLLLAEGSTDNGITWIYTIQPGDPVCAQLRRTNDVGDLMVCDEDSEQDFTGDEELRYLFGGLNDEQVPKFVIGITEPGVEKVAISLPEGDSPEVDTLESPAAPEKRFFVVQLNPEPAQEVLAIRGLDGEGRTVAGFRLGPPDEEPSPLPTG